MVRLKQTRRDKIAAWIFKHNYRIAYFVYGKLVDELVMDKGYTPAKAELQVKVMFATFYGVVIQDDC